MPRFLERRKMALLVWCLMILGTRAIFAQSGPSISNVQLQTPSPLERYSKVEASFTVGNTTGTNFYFPFDANPPAGVEAGTGITVDALMLPPGETDWNRARRIPCFFYQPMEEMGSGDSVGFVPVGSPDWRFRFTPESVGVWTYKIQATDAAGTTESPQQQLEVVASSRKGFVSVSQGDPRFFEFSDGTPLVAPLINVEDGNPFNGLAKARQSIQTLGQNGVRFVRWFPTGEGANYSIIVFGDNISSSWAFGPAWVELGNPDTGVLLSFAPYYYTVQVVPAAVGVHYKLTVRALVAGDKVLNLEVSGTDPLAQLQICANAARCSNVQQGWVTQQIEMVASSDTLGLYLHDGFAETPVDSGEIRIHWATLQRQEGSSWGGNMLTRANPNTMLYMDQVGAARMDEVLRLSEQYGVYHKLTMFHKNDLILNSMLADGTFDFDTWDGECHRFYSAEGEAPRWYEKAYVRYFMARFSHSPALHSVELGNENFFHQHALDASFEWAAYARIQASRPILISNSFWGYFIGGFWCDAASGSLTDYGDKHWYANPQSQDVELISNTWEDSAAYVRQCFLRFQSYHADCFDDGSNVPYRKPIVRGEGGVAESGTQPQHPLIASDTAGVYYHKKVWAHVGILGDSCDGEWYPTLMESNHLWGIYKAYEDFMAHEPINNGRYRHIGTDLTSTSQVDTTEPAIRAWGSQDAQTGFALLWIDNSNHTWKKVVDGANIPPLTGTLTLHTGLANQSFRLRWYDTRSGAQTSSEPIQADSSGDVSLTVTNLTTDIAVKLGSADNVPPKAPTGLIVQ